MSNKESLEIYLSIEIKQTNSDNAEQLSLAVRRELLESRIVQSIEPLPSLSNTAVDGAKGIDWTSLSEWLIKLSAPAVPELIKLLGEKSKQSNLKSPMRVILKTKKGSVEIEYDSALISPDELPGFIEKLRKSIVA
jgi:hypothetical protein